jgi:FMN phosphatase YigB (HAD superfamily)
MVRAIFFDFYSVWAPDKIDYYLATAQLNGPAAYKNLSDSVNQYYHGEIDINTLAQAFSQRLGHPDLNAAALQITKASILPEITNFIRTLHGHFLKIGILANLGTQEVQVLNEFNQENQLFEIIASPLTLGTKAPLFSQEVFARALQAIGEPPASCLMVSGNSNFLAVAANFGIPTLQFEGLQPLEKAIDQLLASDMPQTG